MLQEIERKFRIQDPSFLNGMVGTKIAQGYLSADPERAVRIRIKGDQGFITIKGKSNASGTTRFEWEKDIDSNEAQALLDLCNPAIISKTRYEVKHDGNTWEIDVFHGANEGLLIAEIELRDENQTFSKPDWLGEEITGDPRYYNSYISQNPFSTW
ncbi:adenylate cyclase [Nonlabens spongiae]|uniref:Adenylate cyclase n=1 Tax=Nonlabens spongiae TaxID=331648 RepID=A0A1W6ML18_9FLAO|nr:CYTH domain-containing protein [Nonlabens spongiae]ARN78262.1 adenylate cyclase [Nonlabens spongiae]